ncbi:RING finger protein 32 [Colossoma macropomum]|uniref:RING finger protein 32 n=1 Tax=Colossoma macropomum TaxID=42526 RepID=UPI0018653708|nr:RING finger protein 32 [Colossoma macropomum]
MVVYVENGCVKPQTSAMFALTTVKDLQSFPELCCLDQRNPTAWTQGRSSSRADGGKLAVAAVALQDHITRSVPHLHNLTVSGSVGRAVCPAASTRPLRAQQHREAGHTLGEEREYMLDPDPPPLTLAQRLGLVAAPARRLTAEEWTEVKSRSLQEGDSTQPCVICTEEFRLLPQVLLSCSHVFHKACLKSFERFSGRKCCPMCRREQYETRVIHDGARLYREKCAIRIQARWRGFAARKWYRNVRKLVPPHDPRLRRQFFEAKFQDLNDSLVRSCCSDVEEFLCDVDCSVAASRDVFRLFEQQRMNGQGMEEEEEEEWLEAQEKAVQRDVSDCPICLTPLHSPSGRRVLLLSCSHLFHEPCLQAFERFCVEGTATCPLCRRHYTARPAQGANTYDSK